MRDDWRFKNDFGMGLYNDFKNLKDEFGEAVDIYTDE